MDCEQAYNLISARIDGELSPAEQAGLSAHLETCPACQATADALSAQDDRLRAAFAPRREAAAALAQRVIETIRLEQPRRMRRWPVLPMLFSAAAGFLVALLLFHPWQAPPPIIAGTQPSSLLQQEDGAGRLSVATGLIELLPPGQATWQAMTTGGTIPTNCSIRTGNDMRCEIVMKDGSQVRLNSNSVLQVKDQRTFALDSGEMFSAVKPDARPFQVVLAGAKVTALGTEFDLIHQPGESSLAVVEGKMKVEGRTQEATVSSGERIDIVAGDPARKQRDYNLLLATSWINEILALKGRDNAELNRRINGLLAELGESKMSFLCEPEIRSLGDHCVLPLTRYVQSELSKSPGEQSRRERAARILSDMAQPWSIGDLIPMLRDSDGEVRYSAARALHRLAPEASGRTPEQWRDRAAGEEQAYQQWQQWWASNKSKIPAPPMGREMGPDPSR